MSKKELITIYKDAEDGQDVWLSDGKHTYYIGTYTGVVGPYGTSTGWYQYFNSTYNMYNVVEELFNCNDMDIEFTTCITLP